MLRQKQFPGWEKNNLSKIWIDAIKNKTLPGSNFNYAAELSEMILVGVLAQRFATHLDYDAQNMKVTNRPDLDAYIKTPPREGWSFGENLS